MFLDTVNSDVQIDAVVAETTPPPYAAWRHFPHSCISHHGAACCDTARAWFLAMDFSQVAGESPLTGPRWIRARYDWGPSAHPIHWCEAVKRKALDCGALGALAHECFLARGVASFPAQLIQRYSTEATAHWMDTWKADDVSVHWLDGDTIYHEGCAVLATDGSLRLWDASAAWWINPSNTTGYGSLAALRINCADAALRADFRWGDHRIAPNQWVTMPR